MRIDRNLNIVVPIDAENGTIYVHSTPVSRDVFKQYYLPISKAFSAIYQEGLSVVAGPRVAAMMLETVSRSLPSPSGQGSAWDGRDGVENGLLDEIRRLSNVVMPGDSGWTTLPLDDAIRQKLLSQDDLDEVEGILVFFICASAMHLRRELPSILGGLTKMWGGQIVSSNSTEFANSLPMSTATDNSGETAHTSSATS